MRWDWILSIYGVLWIGVYMFPVFVPCQLGEGADIR